jgi:hypothetical protein
VIETLVALLVVSAALLVALVPWTALHWAGALLVVLGMAVGVPAGLWYHVRLHIELARQPPLPRRWWLSPVQHHARLEAQALRRVRRSFYLGGAGFVVTALGCGVATLGCLAIFFSAADSGL